MTAEKHIQELRERMAGENIQAVYISATDPHQTDVVADHWKMMQWFTNFTGNAGYAVVTMNEAAFWTDGRYVEQMQRELSKDTFIMYNTSEPGTPDWKAWTAGRIPAGSEIALDGEVMAMADYRNCLAVFSEKNIRIVHDRNLPGEIWTDRPAIKSDTIWEMDLSLAGESRSNKIARVREQMASEGADVYLGCCMDDVAWITNLRGHEHPLYPLFHSYMLITQDNFSLFADSEGMSQKIIDHLAEDGITIRPRDEITEALAGIDAGKVVLVDPYKTTIRLYASIAEGAVIRDQMDIITFIKSHKNAVEQENIRRSNIKECIAIVRFIRDVYARMAKGPVREYELVGALEGFREMDPDYLMPANVHIIAYGSNAAIVHYRPKPGKDTELKKEGILLFDVCAHYRTGTTDLTRVIPLGPVTDEMKEDYTMALKAHIALATQHFVYGMTGDVLDGVSKSVLWNSSRHFGHGTGHGIGYVLSLHEGPEKIITEYAPPFPYARNIALGEGMLVSDEPGVYRSGSHGIRLENDLLVQYDCENEFGKFLKFETVTFCPFETSLIVRDLMTDKEISWLNTYHALTYNKLSPYLTEEEDEWLRAMTQPM